MAILRNKTQSGFTVISNNIFRDKRLSMAARGLLCTMLSLPDSWDFSEKGLCKILPENGITAIRTAIKTLEETGYLRRTKVRENGRIVDVLWEITNRPGDFGDESDLPGLENPNLVNQPQLNTNGIGSSDPSDPPHLFQCESNNKESAPDEKTKKTSKPKKRRHGEFGHVLLTNEEFDTLDDKVNGYRDAYIRIVDEYCEKSGRSYKNYSLAIQDFYRRDLESNRLPKAAANRKPMTAGDYFG